MDSYACDKIYKIRQDVQECLDNPDVLQMLIDLANPDKSCKSCLSKLPLPDIREVSLNRCRRRHHRTHEVRAPAASLPPFKVSIARRRAPFTRLQDIRVHPQTHRAPCLAPFETRLVENAIETLALRRLLHLLRTGHNQRTHG